MMQARLIDRDQLIMLWDDVSDEMLPAVIRVTDALRQQFSSSRPYTAVLYIHGTYGGDARGLHRIAPFIHDEALGLEADRGALLRD